MDRIAAVVHGRLALAVVKVEFGGYAVQGQAHQALRNVDDLLLHPGWAPAARRSSWASTDWTLMPGCIISWKASSRMRPIRSGVSSSIFGRMAFIAFPTRR